MGTFPFLAGIWDQGHRRARVGARNKLVIITDPDHLSEPWVPRVCAFQSTFTPISSLGSCGKGRDDGPILPDQKTES